MAFTRHLTLTLNTVTPVTFSAPANTSTFEIINRDAAGEIFVSYDGTAAPTDPTVAGNDFDIVPALIGARHVARRIGVGNIVIKLISSAATKVTIRAVS